MVLERFSAWAGKWLELTGAVCLWFRNDEKVSSSPEVSEKIWMVLGLKVEF